MSIAQIDKTAIITAIPTRIVLALNDTFATVDKSSNLPIHSSPISPNRMKFKLKKVLLDILYKIKKYKNILTICSVVAT